MREKVGKKEKEKENKVKNQKKFSVLSSYSWWHGIVRGFLPLGLAGRPLVGVGGRSGASPGRPAAAPIAFPVGGHPRGHLFRVSPVRPDMLLHVVLAGERLVADRAMDAFLPGVLLAVAGGMARGGKSCGAAMAGSKRARVLVLPDPRFCSHAFLGRASNRRLRGRRLDYRAPTDPLLCHGPVAMRFLPTKVVMRSNAGAAAHVVVGTVGGTGRRGLRGFRHGFVRMARQSGGY